MARHTPTLLECHEWVLEHCTNLLNDSVTTATTTTTSDDKEEQAVVDRRLDDCLMAIESTRIFVNALDSPLTLTLQWVQQLDALTLTLQTRATTLTNMIDIVVQEIESICAACKPWLHPVSYVKCQSSAGPSTSKYQQEYPKVVPRLTPSHYASMWPEPYNCDTVWFRQYFVGNPYVTLIGPPPQHNATRRTAASLDRSDPSLSHQEQHYPAEDDDNNNNNDDDDGLSCAIISVVQETIKAPSSPPPSIHDNNDNDNDNDNDDNDNEETPPQPSSPGIQYRLIIRTKKETICYVLPDNTVKNTLTCLKSLGQLDRLEPSSSSSAHLQKQKQKRRPLRSFSSAIIHHTGTHLTSLSSTSSVLPHEQDDDNDDNDTDTDSTACHHDKHNHNHRRQINNRKCYLLYRLLHAAVLSVYHHLDLRNFKALSAESTILAGLEKELMRFDEMEVPKNYKFGLLTVQDDQTCEEKWLSNTGLSVGLEAFLDIIGQRITLQHYKGYAAGLDTKCGESGKYSYVTSWKDHEIMFHVGPLMPYNAQDKQQVHRKRYIGNDIVCLVFMDTNQPRLFDPASIRSQFLHVFIVVHQENVDGRKCWRVEVVSNKNVEPFGPPIPSPPQFFDELELREFLLLKLVSAENAALQSDKFAIPNAKARQGIVKTLVDMGLAAPTHSLTSSNSFLRSKTGGLDGYLAMIGGGGQSQHDSGAHKTSKTSNNSSNSSNSTAGINHRPKSAGPGGRCYSRASLRSLRAALDISAPSLPFKSSTSSTSLICCSSPSSSTSSSSSLSFVMAQRSLTPEPPNASTPTSSSSSSILFPYSSRSNMLRDLKNLTRRRHSTASTSGVTTLLVNRTPAPSSIVERPFRTNSPPCPPCHSPSLTSEPRHVESPISWTDEEDGAADPSHPPLLTARAFSSSSLSNPNERSTLAPSATASSAYYSSPPSPPPTLDMMKWVGPGEQNQTIRSRAHHLMSAVMRRKQQTTLANSSSSSMISKMSRSKSSYIKD